MTTTEQALFDEFAGPLIGLPVSHVWRGYGSALMLEFGALTSRHIKRDGSLGNPSGEMGLMIEWSWRIEGKRSILCGSWTDEQRWKKTFDRLTRTTVAAATLFGRLPEIDLTLSNRIHVVSLMTAQGDPAWTLFERRSGRVRWIHVKHGKLQIEADIQKQFS